MTSVPRKGCSHPGKASWQHHLPVPSHHCMPARCWERWESAGRSQDPRLCLGVSELACTPTSTEPTPPSCPPLAHSISSVPLRFSACATWLPTREATKGAGRGCRAMGQEHCRADVTLCRQRGSFVASYVNHQLLPGQAATTGRNRVIPKRELPGQ